MILVLLALAALAPLIPHANAQANTVTWQNTTFKGLDPYFCTNFPSACGGGAFGIAAYKTGTTASVSMSLTNSFCSSVKVLYTQLQMDWGNNYTANGLPTTIGMGTVGFITISFPVPATSTASNLIPHEALSGGSFMNYTSPCTTGTQKTSLSNFGLLPPAVAVYSSDQADSIAAFQQLTALAGSGGTGLATTFKTPQGNALFQQAAQQATLGVQKYTTGNFTAAKASLQSAVSLWNQAISAENSHGNTLELNGGLSSYGSLMLGVGAIVGGVGAIVYAIRRPKMPKTA
jgi:hypothetical protein